MLRHIKYNVNNDILKITDFEDDEKFTYASDEDFFDNINMTCKDRFIDYEFYDIDTVFVFFIRLLKNEKTTDKSKRIFIENTSDTSLMTIKKSINKLTICSKEIENLFINLKKIDEGEEFLNILNSIKFGKFNFYQNIIEDKLKHKKIKKEVERMYIYSFQSSFNYVVKDNDDIYEFRCLALYKSDMLKMIKRILKENKNKILEIYIMDLFLLATSHDMNIINEIEDLNNFILLNRLTFRLCSRKENFEELLNECINKRNNIDKKIITDNIHFFNFLSKKCFDYLFDNDVDSIHITNLMNFSNWRVYNFKKVFELYDLFDEKYKDIFAKTFLLNACIEIAFINEIDEEQIENYLFEKHKDYFCKIFYEMFVACYSYNYKENLEVIFRKSKDKFLSYFLEYVCEKTDNSEMKKEIINRIL